MISTVKRSSVKMMGTHSCSSHHCLRPWPWRGLIKWASQCQCSGRCKRETWKRKNRRRRADGMIHRTRYCTEDDGEEKRTTTNGRKCEASNFGLEIFRIQSSAKPTYLPSLPVSDDAYICLHVLHHIYNLYIAVLPQIRYAVDAHHSLALSSSSVA